MFNSREIATAIWAAVALVFVLSKAPVRQSVLSLIRAFLRPKILLSFALMAFYVSAVVLGLSAASAWKPTLLKDTLLWFCFTGLAMFFGSVTCNDAQSIFRRTVVDSVKVVVLIEFLVNTYTFPLPYEIVIVPIVGVIAMMDAVAHTDEKKYAPVGKLTTGALSLVGLVALGFAVCKAIADYDRLRSVDTLRGLLLAPVLSVLFLPFVYLMVVLVNYELVFLRLGFGTKEDRALNRYAKRRIILYCRLNLRRVNDCLSRHSVDLMGIKSKSDVDGLIATMMGRGSRNASEE